MVDRRHLEVKEFGSNVVWITSLYADRIEISKAIGCGRSKAVVTCKIKMLQKCFILYTTV